MRTAEEKRGIASFLPLPRLVEFRRAPLDFLRTAWSLGDVVPLARPPLSRWYLLTRAELIQSVLHAPPASVMMNRQSDVVRAIFGESLFTLSGEPWVARRRLIQPAFGAARGAVLAGIVEEVCGRTMDRWLERGRSGQPVDIMTEMVDITVRVIVKLMFGVDLQEATEDLKRLFTIGMEYRHRRRWSLLKPPMSWPTPENLRFRRALEQVDRVVYKIIAAERRAGDLNRNLLTDLIAARDQDTGEGLADRHIRDEVMTTFTVGHLTMAAALGWAFHEALRRPHVVEKIRSETPGPREEGSGCPGHAAAGGLAFTRSVLLEAMRLYPPVWIITRKTAAPFRLGEEEIPPGSTLVMSQFQIHRHPQYWERPESFEPERFDNLDKAAQRAYFPFGSGKRQCIGGDISMTETTLVLSRLLQAFDLELLDPSPVEPWPIATLVPSRPMLARVRAR